MLPCPTQVALMYDQKKILVKINSIYLLIESKDQNTDTAIY